MNMIRNTRPWGQYTTIYQTNNIWVKLIDINAGESLSLQYHRWRAELWVPLEAGLRGVINGNILDLRPDMRYDIPINVVHRITNPTDRNIGVVEVAIGMPEETDIIRIHDKYGRNINTV